MEPLPVEPEVLLNIITGLIKQVISAKAEIANYTISNQQHDYVVMLLTTRHPTLELVIKLAGPAASISCHFEETAMLHRMVAARTTIVMPEVLAADSSYRTWPWRYLIRMSVSGEEWADVSPNLSAEELASAHAQIGDAVAQLHGIEFPTFGEISSEGQVREGKPYLQALRNRVEGSINNQRLRELFLSIVENNASLFVDVGEATLCHEDIHRHNLLLRQDRAGWRLATILDFDKAWSGCPESDLARLELWDGMTSASFWHAYRARREVASRYEQRRPFFQLLWCLEYARPTKKHLADTNRLCERLGLPVLETFA
jgi:aminoglycoside phosphotransferase (APT) family kinase protein